jgi:hypothetical protein
MARSTSSAQRESSASSGRSGAGAHDRARRSLLVEQVDACEGRVLLGQHLDETARTGVDRRGPLERLAEAHEKGARVGGLDRVGVEPGALDREAALLRDAEDDVPPRRAAPRPFDEPHREDTEHLATCGAERNADDGLDTGSLPELGQARVAGVELGVVDDLDDGLRPERVGHG